MFRWILLTLAVAFATLGSLTVVKAPDWVPWKTALLAGEYGHWLAVAPVLVVAVAWWKRGPALRLARGIVGVALLAAVLLLRPVATAWWLARSLPEELERQFGRVEMGRAAFSFGALAGEGVAPVAAETRPYASGLAMDFYRAVGRERAPCVIVVHGGGWDGGDRTEIAHFNHWLARRGFAVAAIDYRLAPKFTWPAPRDDVLAALAYVKANAPTLGIDPTRLVLFGRSAGGNIAEATAYAAADPTIRGVIAFYAPADLHFAYVFGREDDVLKSPHLLRQYLGGPPEAARAAYDSASGYLQVTKSARPTLLVHGRLDPLVWHRQSERLAKRLAARDVSQVFVSLPWATHACEYNLRGPGGQLTTFAVEWFLAAVTK
ncbi:MAG: alpha/beta hydrolase [Verrucomicrobia bacterium]|nr:alpha/beta hydrolase [Verrucomicrobiota bacterium]